MGDGAVKAGSCLAAAFACEAAAILFFTGNTRRVIAAAGVVFAAASYWNWTKLQPEVPPSDPEPLQRAVKAHEITLKQTSTRTDGGLLETIVIKGPDYAKVNRINMGQSMLNAHVNGEWHHSLRLNITTLWGSTNTKVDHTVDLSRPGYYSQRADEERSGNICTIRVPFIPRN